MKLLLCQVTMKLLILVVLARSGSGQNEDQFNYRETVGNDYGPRDWGSVECEDLETCPGWPEKWHMAYDWELNENHCLNCEEQDDDCPNDHQQSPLNFQRRWGLNEQVGAGGVMNCGDEHWMKYETGTCTWDHLVAADAITVERHALRIAQPLELVDGEYQLNCLTQGRGRLYSRVDWSGGFAYYWFLDHINIKVPSEHTQEGKRYSGEIQMGHFYTRDRGQRNSRWIQMGTIAIFLEASEAFESYPYLDKLICQWRKHEDKVREGCGYGSVKSRYPGCIVLDRPGETIVYNETTSTEREVGGENGANKTRTLRRRKMVLDSDATEKDIKLNLDPRNFRDSEVSEEEWAAFQEEYSRKHPIDSPNRWSTNETRRHLLDYEHVTHFNHQFLLDVRTEYYFRYEGSMTFPPCYGEGGSSTYELEKTNNWRFMKDPIRIHTTQLEELHRLLRERIAPVNSTQNACRPDTAANVSDDGSVWVARPLQTLSKKGHNNYFCECVDWRSKVPEDRAWCQSGEEEQRWFDNPYNFKSNGF